MFGFGFGLDSVEWTNDTAFDLGISGDTILTYCMSADGIPTFIHGLSYAKEGWANATLSADAYGLERSSLPAELSQFGYGSVQVPYHQNLVYNGTSQGLEKQDLLQEFAKPSNYAGSNVVRYEMPQLDGPDDTSAAAAAGSSSRAIAVAILVAISAWAVTW